MRKEEQGEVWFWEAGVEINGRRGRGELWCWGKLEWESKGTVQNWEQLVICFLIFGGWHLVRWSGGEEMIEPVEQGEV